jgi:DNA-binding transcriptional LysR family regulator
MKLDYLREFVALAERLNYTQAASNLYMTQPALSRHIQSIEEELGVRLLKRSTHDVVLTDAGRTVLEGFRETVRCYDDALEHLRLSSKGLVGTLCFGILYYAIEDYLERSLKRFRRQCPAVDISVHSFQPLALADALLTGNIDAGLTHALSVPSDKRCASVSVGSEPLVALLSQKHPLAESDKISINDLAHERFVFIEREAWHQSHIESLLLKHQIQPTGVILTEQIDTLPIAVLKHKAVTIVPSHVGRISWTGLAHARFKERSLRIEMAVAYSTDNKNPVLKMLIQSLTPTA